MIEAPKPYQTFQRKHNAPLSSEEIMTGAFRNSATSIGLSNVANETEYDPIKEYDYEAQAEKLNNQANEIRAKISQQRFNNQIATAHNRSQRRWNQAQNRWEKEVSQIGQPDPMFRSFKNPSVEFQAFAQAISGQESGGNYRAVNPDSGALGRYQVMPGNIAGQNTGWDYQVLGRDITPQRYLRSNRLQDRIALGMLRGMFRREGVRGAASEWYSGDPNAWQDTRSQGDYPSINQYVTDVYGKYRQNLRQLNSRLAPARLEQSGFKGMGDPLKGQGNWGFGSLGDFGTRSIGQGFHTGLDFEASQGTPVYAAQSGRIARQNYDSGYGNQVFINGDNKTQTRYQHLAAFNEKLKPGDFVKKGQLIGYVGNTGSYSEGNHLHFEAVRRGVKDPSRFDPRQTYGAHKVAINPWRFFRRFNPYHE